MKEVQQLIRSLAALSHFLFRTGNKAFLFFVILREKEKFEWTPKSEEDFSKIKKFFKLPQILTRPKEGSSFLI